MASTEKIYMYCPECNKTMSLESIAIQLPSELKKRSVFSYTDFQCESEDFGTSEKYKMSERICSLLEKYQYFDKYIRCTHNHSHLFKFSFVLKKTGDYPNESLKIVKIGQFPSINDFNGGLIKPYQKLLEGYRKEYTKALGLFSAGIGIGSFVYLRRIFEFLLENAFKNAEAAGVLTREQYMKDGNRNRKVSEKVKLLKDFLPDFMVSHCEIYGIISKGIHELSEDECKENFPVLQKSIELILDEKLAREKKETDIIAVENELEKLIALYKKIQ